MTTSSFGTEEDFQRFLRDLGPEATNYTSAEERQLYAEVHCMAEFLLDLFRDERRKITEAATRGIRIEPAFIKGATQPPLAMSRVSTTDRNQLGLEL